jgi:hypothetical protein
MSTITYTRPLRSASFEATLDRRLFTPTQIAAASLLGGPLAGFALITANFRRLSDATAAKGSALAGMVVAALLWLTVYANLPHLPWYTAVGGPVITAAFLWLAAGTLQGPDLKAHAIAGGETASTWHALEIGVLAAAAQLVAFAGAKAIL